MSPVPEKRAIQPQASAVDQPRSDIEKAAVVDDALFEEPHKDVDSDQISQDAQAGVQAMQAATKVWTKAHLTAAYGLVWLIYCVIAMQEPLIRALTPYVTSSFRLHSLTATTGIIASIVSGLIQIPLAKILDTWGRPEGLTIMLVIWVLGFIMMATCSNVETYCAAQVFSSVGSSGVSYTLTVFVSDTSSLKSRALMLAFATSPYIAFSWVGGPISQSVLDGPGWRWGFGIWAIVLPAVVLPLAALLEWNQRKARKAGLISSKEVSLSWEAIQNYVVQVDLGGCIILAGGLALFLLPFSLYSYQADQWESPMIICMLVFGCLLLIGFVFYERFVAPVTFIPFHLLMDRTVFSAGIMFLLVFFNNRVWGAFFGSQLQVVWDLDVKTASYITSVRRVGQCLFGVLVGVLIRWTGRFKWIALSLGIPLYVLALGLLIRFRNYSSDIGLVAMCQIFAGLASGAVVLTGELAMMTPSDHQHIAVIIAVLNIFCSIGSAAGGSVASAIWTGVFPQKLAKYLPEGVDAAPIYADITQQMSYPMGSPERDAIALAYADTQRLLLITSIGLLAGGLGCVFCWRNLEVKNNKQVKGVVVE